MFSKEKKKKIRFQLWLMHSSSYLPPNHTLFSFLQFENLPRYVYQLLVDKGHRSPSSPSPLSPSNHRTQHLFPYSSGQVCILATHSRVSVVVEDTYLTSTSTYIRLINDKRVHRTSYPNYAYLSCYILVTLVKLKWSTTYSTYFIQSVRRAYPMVSRGRPSLRDFVTTHPRKA